MDPGLNGKRAFVTGGSGDIGRAVVRELATSGALVDFAYFSDHEGAEQTAALARGVGGHVPSVFRVNLGDGPSTRAFLTEVQQKLERVDLFVHCAASGVFRDALGLTPRHMKWSMDVNAYSFFDLMQTLAAPRGERTSLLHPGSTVVALSSLGAVRAIPQYTAAAASKAALESMVRQLALELGPRGIRLNAVSPGLVMTRALAHFPNKAELVAAAEGRTPLGRLTTPEDVACVVAFLLSSRSGMIHGQTIDVDGGYSIVG